jgi:hypothetical protein
VVHIEQDWQLRIDTNARRAEETRAQACGKNIARGLQERLEGSASKI